MDTVMPSHLHSYNKAPSSSLSAVSGARSVPVLPVGRGQLLLGIFVLFLKATWHEKRKRGRWEEK